MSTDLERRVKAGAKLLDTEYPEWHTAINLDHLSMVSTHACVLGQVFGDYGRGLEMLGMDGVALHQREQHGFTNPGYRAWTKLTNLWRDEVIKRMGYREE